RELPDGLLEELLLLAEREIQGGPPRQAARGTRHFDVSGWRRGPATRAAGLVTWRDAAARGPHRSRGRDGPGRLRLPGLAGTRTGARPGPDQPRPHGRDAPARGGGTRRRAH